jgi:hypothetical protein
LQGRGDGPVGPKRVGAAAQQHRVASLEAEPGGVGRDVGARLVDHADDAERDAHLAHLNAAGPLSGGAHLAHGVGKRGHVAQCVGHFLDALGGKEEAVEEGVGEAVLSRGGHVALVGRQDVVLGRLQGLGHAAQGAVFGVGGERAQRAGGLFAVRRKGFDGWSLGNGLGHEEIGNWCLGIGP